MFFGALHLKVDGSRFCVTSARKMASDLIALYMAILCRFVGRFIFVVMVASWSIMLSSHVI